MPTWLHFLLVSIAIGLISGTLGGMFGFGGSSVSTPLLRVMIPALNPLSALGTPLPVAIPTAIAGVIGYYRRGLVQFRVALLTILGGMPGVLIGAYLTKYISGHWLMLFTAVTLLGIGIRSAVFANAPTEEVHIRPTSADLIAVLIGIPAGIFAGVLANGGGPLLVPAYLTFLNMTMLEAVATSLSVVMVLSVPGSIIHWYLGHVDAQLMLFMTIGVIPASLLGSKIAHQLGDARLKNIFGWAMVLFGAYFFYREWR